MRGLHGETMLTAWDRCRATVEPRRALALLELVAPEISAETLLDLPLSRRDALLLKARALTFGPGMDGFAICPDCGSPLEFALDSTLFLEGLENAPGPDGTGARPATTEDLLASLDAPDEQQAQAILLSRTLGVEPPVDGAVPDHWVERFESLNSASEIRIQLECAACGGRPVLDLDVVRFFVREIGSAAKRLLREIHALASAYGWSETSIAAMDENRRAAYLEMLDA